ncbi:hypothetical protein KJ359_006247 [Pestalotiopsis sp. 9143b]|nr:hypothetical protein KJ359_006247 [Pestalotiopsis sp. 9143b]
MELPGDIAEQQAAALNYEPELEGPKVGEKRSSNEIADAFIGDETHPVFVAKSRALPRKYSHWRKVQGDGNCGWRAIGFAYFETLVQRGDVDVLSGELARVSSLDSYLMNVGGFDTMLFEDMTSVTLDLFQELIAAFEEGQDTGADATEHAMSILFDKWNDPDASNSMIYHLRLLAASYLKGNVAQYRDFIAVAGGEDQSVDLYCDSWILPVAKEIDHVAIDLLFHVLIAGADIVLEIAYLDTNEGAEVKQGRWPPEANDMKPEELGPTINLLFRPGHYDLLYRRENQPSPPPPPSAPAVVQVNRVSSLSHQHQPQSNFSSLGSFSSIDMGIMSMIPGSSLGGPPSAFQPSVFGTPSPMSPMESAYSPPAQTTWIPQQSADGPAAAPSPLSPSYSGPSQPSPQPQMPNPTRFSKYCFTVAAEPPAPPPLDSSHQALQTPTFKQSFYNPAHYANPGFTPEQWKPDQEDHVPRGRTGGRNKSS